MMEQRAPSLNYAQLAAIVFVTLSLMIGSFVSIDAFHYEDTFVTDDDPLAKVDPSLHDQASSDEEVDILVSYTEGVDRLKMERALAAVDESIRIVELFSSLNIVRLKLLGYRIPKIAEQQLFTRIWPNRVSEISPSRANSFSVSSLDNYTPLIDLINARSLWDRGYNGTGVVIAVLDTGIDFLHPDLDDFDDDANTTDTKVTAFASFVEGDTLPLDIIGHGTYAASIAAGTGNQSEGLYAGIAPGAILLSAKVTLGGLFAAPSWIVSGIEWACSRGADIILMPFNTFGAPGDAVEKAIQAATERGVLVIAAAGDDGPDYLTILSPGGSTSALTVGAYDVTRREVPSFSGRGPTLDLMTKPDLVAPGVGIVGAKMGSALADLGLGDFDMDSIGAISSLLGGSIGESIDDYYIVADTTTASAAIVAGAAAILMQAFDRATPLVISNVLRDTATSLEYGPNDAGAGLLNLEEAFNYISTKQVPLDPVNRTTGIPLLALGFVTANADSVNTTMLISSFGTQVVVVDSRAEKNSTVHLLMGMMSLKWNNMEPTNLMMFEVKRELHQVYAAVGVDNYNRYIGVLSYDDLMYVALLVESYDLTLTNDEPLIGFKITPFILNIGSEPLENVSLFMSYSLDLFIDGEDDYGQYDLDTHQLYAYSHSEDFGDFYFGVNSSRNFDAFDVANSSEIASRISEDNLTNNTSFNGTVGLGMRWDFDTVSPFKPVNVTITLGFAENKTFLDRSIETMWELEPSLLMASQGDLMVVEADMPRVVKPDTTYKSTAVIMNIGVNPSSAVAALAVVKETDTGGNLFSSYFNFEEIQPFDIRTVQAEWRPEKQGIHTVAWVTATGIMEALDLVTDPIGVLTPAVLSLLNSFLVRNVFVVDPIPSVSVFPQAASFAPFSLRFPADFGLYGFTLFSTIPLGNLTVINHGNASDWGSMDLAPIDSIEGVYSFSLFLFVPPIIMDGYHYCDYALMTEQGWTTNITLRTELRYPRAMILLDTSHGGGFASLGFGDDFGGNLDAGVSDEDEFESLPAQDSNGNDTAGDPSFDISDFGSLDSITELLESFRMTTFSALSDMKRIMADADLDLVETPGIDLDADLLSQFSGVLIISPTQEFNSTDISLLRDYSSSGGKLVIFGDYEERANLTALNSLLFEYGYYMEGKHTRENTTEIVPGQPLSHGVDSVWLGGGTYIYNNESNAVATLDNQTVILADLSPPQLILFGSSRIFINKNLPRCNNTVLLDNLNLFFLENTLTTRTFLAENKTHYPAGRSVYMNLELKGFYGEPANDLFVAIAFQLPNGSLSFFIAGFVGEGLYTTQLAPSYWSDEGRINGIFIILRDENYAGTYASITFYLYKPPVANTTSPEQPFLRLSHVAAISAGGGFGALLFALAWNYRRRRVRYRIPELDPYFIQDIDNTLNNLLAAFIQIEELIQRKDLNRVEKVEDIRGMMKGLEKAQERFEKVSKRVGGV